MQTEKHKKRNNYYTGVFSVHTLAGLKTTLHVALVCHLQVNINITSALFPLFFYFFYYITDLLCGTVQKESVKKDTYIACFKEVHKINYRLSERLYTSYQKFT